MLSILTVGFLASADAAKEQTVSSVWCQGEHTDHRHCTFKNLCYSPYAKEFLFFHSGLSNLSGVEELDEHRRVER